jgi:hypothetical protein
MFGGSQVRTHGSVEDLIRSTLGARFIEAQPQPIQEESNPANKNVPDDNFGKMEIPTLGEISEVDRNINPQKKEKGLAPKPVCNECKMIESECICGTEDEDELEDGNFTFSDPSESYIDFIEPDEVEEEMVDELTPFQQVLRSGKFKKPDASPERERIERFQNTEGIGLNPKKERLPVEPISKYYPFYRDRDEVFECKVTIEGTISTATARLVLVTDTWNLVFYGKIKRDGTCIIPIKKLVIFPQGTTGRATLEVVVDDVVFSAWENAFRVEESKKVKVQIKGKS